MADLYGSSIGSTIKARELLGHLCKRGHAVTFFWRYEKMPLKSKRSKTNKRSLLRHPLLRRFLYTPKEIAKNIFDFIAEYRFIVKHKPDIIISRVDAYRFSSPLLAKWCNIPLLLEADGANSYEWLQYNNRDGIIWKRCLLFIEKLNFRIADQVFVQSTVTKNYYDQLYGCGHKIGVITNAATPRTSSNRAALRAEFSMQSSSVVCGFLGSLHYWHGTNVLQELISRVVKKYDQLVFLIIGGGGPNADDFKAFCYAKPWSNRMIILDYQDHAEVHHYINLFDIALAPYTDQNLFYYSPVKIFEYMALAKPVLTVPVGQIGEIIQHGYNGYFFKPGCISDLEEKLAELIHNSDLRQTLGRNALVTIRQHHTWNHKAKQLEQMCIKAKN